MNWNESFIQKLVVDGSTLREGEKIARSGTWNSTGQDARLAWGLVQGSGKSPYQVCIDLQDAATRCSCPSRKFPCKHAVALMFLLSQDTLPVNQSPPAWAATWRDGREKKREPAAPSAKPVDTAAQAKREATRVNKVEAGLEELRLWIEDLIRQGLSNPAVQTYAFWDRIAARMVDAQMTPVARRLRALGGLPFKKKTDWVGLMVDELGTLYALIEAYQRLDSLPAPLAYDVRAALGFTLKQEEVIALGEAVTDQWQVLGTVTESLEQLVERRVWLYGVNTGRYALLLDYAHRSRLTFDRFYPAGFSFEGDVVYYPGAYPQRAIGTTDLDNLQPITSAGVHFHDRVEVLLSTYADALAVNPFLQRVAGGLERVRVNRSAAIDSTGHQLPQRQSLNAGWLAAVTGGDVVKVVGEWDGRALQTLALITTEGWAVPGEWA